MILDEEVLLTGSVNTTDCGMRSNKEHMIIIREPTPVQKCQQDFDSMWAKATPLSQVEIDAEYKKYSDKGLDRIGSRGRSVNVRRAKPSPELQPPQSPVSPTADTPTSE